MIHTLTFPDASIWLTQIAKAFGDDKMAETSLHLRALLGRVNKLLWQGIRCIPRIYSLSPPILHTSLAASLSFVCSPVFVFDGETPEIKIATTRTRKKARESSKKGNIELCSFVS